MNSLQLAAQEPSHRTESPGNTWNQDTESFPRLNVTWDCCETKDKVLGFAVCHRRISSSRKWNRWMHPSPITYYRLWLKFHHWPLLRGVGNTITFLLTLLREDLLTSGINSSLSSYHHLWIEGTKVCLSCLLLHRWWQVCPQSKVIAILMISVIARASYLLDVREWSEWM